MKIDIKDKEAILKKLLKFRVIVGECWIHSGTKVKGHGYIRIGHRMYYSHRLSAYIHLGLDINDQVNQANHKPICINKACWNPDHLYVGTQKDNVHDAIPNIQKELCHKGHIIDGRSYLRYSHRYRRYCRECDRLRKVG